MSASERKIINPPSPGFFANKSTSTPNLGIFMPISSADSYGLLKKFADSKKIDMAWLLRESNESNMLLVDLVFKDPETNRWRNAAFRFQLTSNGWENSFALTGTPLDMEAENSASQVQLLLDFLQEMNIGEGYSSWLSILQDRSFTEESRMYPSPSLQSTNPLFTPQKTELKTDLKAESRPPRTFVFNANSWIPEGLTDPVSHQAIKDPATTMLGSTYERSIIEDHIKLHNTDPISRKALPTKILITNYALKELIDDLKVYNELKDEKAKKKKFDEIAERFNDSISGVTMVNPVLTMTGQSYDANTIKQWFKEHGKDPLTGEMLDEKQRGILIPNVALKDIIEEYQAYKTFLEKHDVEAAATVAAGTEKNKFKPR